MLLWYCSTAVQWLLVVVFFGANDVCGRLQCFPASFASRFVCIVSSFTQYIDARACLFETFDITCFIYSVYNEPNGVLWLNAIISWQPFRKHQNNKMTTSNYYGRRWLFQKQNSCNRFFFFSNSYVLST